MNEALSTAPYKPEPTFLPKVFGLFDVFLWGVFLSLAAFGGFMWYEGMHRLVHEAGPFDFKTVVPLGLIYLASVAMVSPTRLVFWNLGDCVKWDARVALVLLVVFLLGFQAILGVEGWLCCGAFAAMLIAMHEFACRYARGWFIDPAGERQKALHVKDGYATYRSTTWVLRRGAEMQLRADRRKQLLMFGLPGAILSMVAMSAYQTQSWLVLASASVIAVPLTVRASKPAVFEILYFLGFQDMEGAQVFDAPPKHPGLEQVLGENKHGDAKPADETEALNILDPFRRA